MSRESQLPRRTLQELRSRYALEPELVDIYVEGPNDRMFYKCFLDSVGCTNYSIFEVGIVDIAAEIVKANGLENGNRGRAITLAITLDEFFPATLKSVRVVADSDYDFVLGARTLSLHVLYTDYTDLEMYMWTPIALENILAENFSATGAQLEAFMTSGARVLEELFVIRAATKKLGWEVGMPRFTRCCKQQDGGIEFDRREFATRLLNSRGRAGHGEEFEEACEEIMASQVSDRRLRMSGEDMLELLGWFLKEQFGWNGYRRDERSAMPLVNRAAEVDALKEEELFRHLRSLCSGTAQ